MDGGGGGAGCSLSLSVSLTDIWVQKMSEIILVEAMGDGLSVTVGSGF